MVTPLVTGEEGGSDKALTIPCPDNEKGPFQAPWVIALMALALAVGSGKLMQENWLRDGQLDHVVYSLHLTAWLLIAAPVVWHVAGVLRRGGLALAGSMLQLQVRRHDRPKHWLSQLIRGFRRST